jgi:hypothetical protein
MQNILQIRFIATNFYNLQGLRAVPLGALLVMVCAWANAQNGPARDLSLPIIGLFIAAAVLFAIDRYYLHTFGRVQRTAESRRLEWLVSVGGGILALIAFVLDTRDDLPLSLLGLVFAVMLLADYLRITWLVKGRFLMYYPIGALLMGLLSVLPLLGLEDWWLKVGIRDQLVAISSAIGIFTLIAGLWGHIFLVRTLPRRVEADHEHAV